MDPTDERPEAADRREVTRRRQRAGGRWVTAVAAVLVLVLGVALWLLDPAGWFGGASGGLGPRGTAAVLYLPDARWTALVPRELPLAAQADPVVRIRRIAEALADVPESEGVDPLLRGVRVRGVYLGADGLAIVDLESESGDFDFGGASGELLAVYSLVNSLAANVPEVRRVRLLRNGEEAETLAGHVKISDPLAPDPSLAAVPES